MSTEFIVCGNCRTELPADALFCCTCGTPLGGDVRCRTCYAANPTGSAFCQQCGQALPQPGESNPVDEMRSELQTAAQKLDLLEEQNHLNARERELYTAEKRNSKEAQTQQLVDASRLEQGAEFQMQQFEREGRHRAALDDAQRQDEAVRQREEFQAQRQDRAQSRTHQQILEKWERKQAELEREMAYKRQLVVDSQELDEQQRAYKIRQLEEEHRRQIEKAKLDLAAQNALADQEQVARLARTDREFEQSQRLQQAEQEAARAQKRADRSDDLQHDRARGELESEQDARSLQMAMEAQARLLQLKQQQKDADAQREVDSLRGKSAVETATQRARHEMDLERLGKLNELSSEALIAASPADQARLLAELQQTEALKGMTEEQILARAAERSPAVAAAIAEKFKSAGSQAAKEEMQALYERMFSSQQSQSQQHLESMQRLMETALKTQRDTSVAAASGGRPTAASSAPPAQEVGGFCRQCGQPLASSARFCRKCGTAQA